jgi:hypothetical protein
MPSDKYKKWDEIINPALERSRRKKRMDPFASEISRAIGISDDDAGRGKDIWSNGKEEPAREEQSGEADIAPPRGPDLWEGSVMPDHEAEVDRPPRKSAYERWNEPEPEGDAGKDMPAEHSLPPDAGEDHSEDAVTADAPDEGSNMGTLDRWSTGPPPHEPERDGDHDPPSHRWGQYAEEEREAPSEPDREPALDRWGSDEPADRSGSKDEGFGYSVEMTEEERLAFKEKRKKLKNVMDEFMSWKGSME